MTFDKAIAGRARKAIADCGEKRQQYVEDRITDWERACALSNGPDPNRCAHWEKIAAALRTELMAIANRHLELTEGKCRGR